MVKVTGLLSLIQYMPSAMRAERLNVGYWLLDDFERNRHSERVKKGKVGRLGDVNWLPYYCEKGSGSSLDRAVDCLGGTHKSLVRHLSKLEKILDLCNSVEDVQRVVVACNANHRFPLYMTEINPISVDVEGPSSLPCFVFNELCSFPYKWQGVLTNE